MAQELMHSQTTAPHVAGFEVVGPFSSRALFWRPRFLRESEALTHLPFLFWVAETLRPKSIVSLGGGDGVAHFALCQATEKLDLDSRAYGFGPWGAAEAEVPGDLRDYNREHFPDFSRLSASTPDVAAAGFPAGSVDLLNITLSGAISQTAQILDWIEREWAPRMSSHGVILLHGVNALLERNWADGYLLRLMETRPSFHLDTGTGVILVQLGDEAEDRLTKLCQLRVGDAGYAAALQIFSRLGGAIQNEMTARQEARRADGLQQQLADAGRDLEQARAAGAAVQARLGDLQQEQGDSADLLRQQSQALAQMQAHLETTHQRASDLMAELGRQAGLAADLERMNAEQQAEIARLVAEQAAAATEKDHSAALQAQQSAETTVYLESLRQKMAADAQAARDRIESLAGSAESLTAERDALTATLAEREAAAADLARRHMAEKAQAEAQLAESARHIGLLTAEREALAAQLADSEQAVASLTESRAADAEAAATQIAELGLQADLLTEELAERTKTIASLTEAGVADAEVAAAQIADLSQQVEALTAERATLTAQLAESTATVAQLTEAAADTAAQTEEQAAEFTRQARLLTTAREAVMAQLAESQTSLADMTAARAAEAQAAEALNADFNRQSQLLTAEREALAARLTEGEATLANLTESHMAEAKAAKAAKAQIDELSRQSDMLTAERDALAQHLAERDAILAERTESHLAESRAAEERIAESARHADILTAEREALGARLQDLEAAVLAVRAEHEQAATGWSAERLDLTAQVEAALAAAKTATDHSDGLLRQAHLLTADRDDAEAQLAERDETIIRLAAALDAAQQAIDQAMLDLAEQHVAVNSAELAALRDQVADLTNRHAEAEAARQALEQQNATLAASLADQLARQHDDLAQLTSAFEARQIEADAKRAEMADQSRKTAVAQEELAAAAQLQEQEILGLQTLMESLRADARREQERLAALHEDDIENLRVLLRVHQAEAETANASLLRLKADQDKIIKERNQLQTHARALEQAVDQMLTSTSWKLTAPMRSMLNSVRKR